MKAVNKRVRHLEKMKHYWRRIKNYGLDKLMKSGILPEGKLNNYALRSHGTPCSCGICRREKYDRAKANNEIRKEIRNEV